jgi:hypothetical protein
MKRVYGAALGICAGLLLGWPAVFAQDDPKAGAAPKSERPLKVGKDGLKLKGKLTKETKNVQYAIALEEGQTYQIRLNSKSFDAYLFLKDAKGKQLDYDDDSGGGTNSLLEYRVLTAGVYVVMATSLGMEGTGDYELIVTRKP